MLKIKLFFALIAVLTAATTVAEPADIDYNIPRILKPAKIDGVLADKQWQNALKISLDYITWPVKNKEAPVSTVVYIYEDGINLYVAFEAEDLEPKKIRSFYRDRDKLSGDDSVVVIIDAFNEHRLTYNFEANPVAAKADYIRDILRNSVNHSWDALWEVSSKIHSNGYVTEFKIPFSAINFKKNQAQQIWGMSFVRIYPREIRYRLSNNTIDYSNNCWMCQNLHFAGMQNLKNTKKVQITPSLTYGNTTSRDLDQTPFSDYSNNHKSELGLDLKWSIGTDLTVNATINPDFSQVEADVPQLSLNNNFSLSFPEKRLFFLDNIEYFASPSNLVYTRNISNPDYGLKTTGRSGNHSFGVLVAKDDSTNFIVPGNLNSSSVSLDTESDNAILRYSNHLNDDLTLGFISTLRSSNNYNNSVNAIDLQYKIDKNQTVVAQFINSDSKYPTALENEFCDNEEGKDNQCEAAPQLNCSFSNCIANELSIRAAKENISDNAYRLQYSNERTNWWYFAAHYDIGSDFRADLGFIDRVDINKTVAGGGLFWNSDGNTWWTGFRISGDSDITYNNNKEQLEQENEIQFRLSLIKRTNISLSFFERDKIGNRHNSSILDIKNNSTVFNENNVELFINSVPANGLYLEFAASSGNRIDFTNNRLGKRQIARAEIKWNFTKKAFVGAQYIDRNFTVANSKLFDAYIADIRLTYNFSNKSLIRLASSDVNIRRNTKNYIYDNVDPVSISNSTQLVYSYKINSYSVFFFGYSDNGYSPDGFAESFQEGRSVFSKISYSL